MRELDDGLAVGPCPDNVAIAEGPPIATAGTGTRRSYISTPEDDRYVPIQGGPCKAGNLRHLARSRVGERDGCGRERQVRSVITRSRRWLKAM